MLPGKTFTPDEILSILLRRRWMILLPFAVGLALAPAVASVLPKVYRSETLIMVIPQRVPDTYVRSTVTATVEDRLPSISDQILSRTRLERIITDFDLYRDLRARAAMEDVVARMRQDIGPVQIQAGQQSFRVSYVSPEPVTAQKVTARLASLFIEENSRDRENLAESTNVFLESQLEDAKQRLLEHERKLEAFRREHAGELPSQLATNLQAMGSAQLQLQSVGEAQNRARERRLLFERQLADVETTPASATTVTSAADGVAVSQSVTQQLETVQARLDALKLKYTADHPDVRALERTVRELKPLAEAEARRAPETPSVQTRISPAEQARQKRIRDLQAEIEVIDRQLQLNQSEEVRLKALIADYSHKIDVVPARESQMVELTRDYDVLKKTYDSLVSKREDSRLAANLERRQIGEQFRILDPASLPAKPANQQKRLALIFSGALVGLALGALLSAFLEYRDSSFKREDEIVRILTLPVLALVPVITSVHERRTDSRRRLAIDVSASALCLGAIATVVIWGLPLL